MKAIEELSLGWRTELIFPRFDAEVIARADGLLVRTPHNPTFYWGNYLLYDRPPREGDAARWLAAFDAEIASRQPASRHLAFGVDTAAPFELPADFAALPAVFAAVPAVLAALPAALATGWPGQKLRAYRAWICKSLRWLSASFTAFWRRRSA